MTDPGFPTDNVREEESCVKAQSRHTSVGGKVLLDNDQPKRFRHIRRGKSVVWNEGLRATSHPRGGKVLLRL